MILSYILTSFDVNLQKSHDAFIVTIALVLLMFFVFLFWNLFSNPHSSHGQTYWSMGVTFNANNTFH